MQIKLMLADDHPLFIEGLQYLLETYGINVAGMAKNGREALEKARVLKPDIILMDIRMPELSGLDAMKLIKAELPDIKVVMLTTSDEDEDLFDAVRYGASGYLLKSTDGKALIDMLTDLEKGEVPFSPGLAGRLLKEYRRKISYNGMECNDISCDSGGIKGGNTCAGNLDDATDNIEMSAHRKKNLTDRQLEILEMVARGITYKEAGEILGLTERTVKYHMGRILELLHLENRSQVIAYAARMGLIKKTYN